MSLLFVSPISSWEIATLIRKRRLALNQDAEDWFEGVLKIPGVALANIDWKALTRSVTLPGEPPNDPADRILVSTARRQQLRMITRDREILEFSRAGHVDAIAC